jgi:hypothetical protein
MRRIYRPLKARTYGADTTAGCFRGGVRKSKVRPFGEGAARSMSPHPAPPALHKIRRLEAPSEPRRIPDSGRVCARWALERMSDNRAKRASPFAPSALLRRTALCPPQRGPSGATVEAAGRLSPNPSRRPLRRPKRPHSRRLAVREGRVPPDPPALGRTHNDGAPVLKLGQGLFSEIATFTLESGPRPSVPLDLSLLYRETVLPERRGHT